MTTSNGKWADPEVPHDGWINVDIEDLGHASAICEMCEVMEIRYVHYMEHREYPDGLKVGCVCAEHMEGDSVGPRLREKRLRDRARRRKSWGERRWYSGWPAYFSGYLDTIHSVRYLNTEGYELMVLKRDDGTWRVRVRNRETGERQYGKRSFATDDEAQAAALDALLWAKEHLR